MTEPQAVARLDEHACGPGLVHGRDQVRDAPAEYGGQVGHGEVHAQQGGGAQDLPHPGRNEAEPVRDGRGQGAWRAIARQLCGPPSETVRLELRASASTSSVR